MYTDTEQRINRIRNQTKVPVIIRQGSGNPLLIHLPYALDNRAWIRGNGRIKPKWEPKDKCWETPKAWFHDLVEKSLSRYGKVYIIQPYRKQEKCAPACWNAEGYECQCSCMGENHGSQGTKGRWLVISDTFATRWRTTELACRLITKRNVSV